MQESPDFAKRYYISYKWNVRVLARLALFMDQSRSVLPLWSAKSGESVVFLEGKRLCNFSS